MLTTQQRLAGLPLRLAQQIASIAQLIDHGRLTEVEPVVSAAIEQTSGHPEILRLAGILRIAQGRPEEAIALLSRARELQLHDPLIHFALARAFELAHDGEQALVSMQQACIDGPELADCWYGLGRMLLDSGQIESAIEALRNALTRAPDHVNARTLLALILNLDGHPEQAQEEYRRILARSAHSGAAWWGLATLKPMPLTEADIAQMQQVLQQSQLQTHERIPMGFALAHALEHRGDYAKALQVLRDTHAVASLGQQWDARQFKERIESVVGKFSQIPLDTISTRGSEVVFIVSLPRSGSTLVEQVLASHSQVQGTSELPDLPQIIRAESVRMRQPFPRWVATHTESDWSALGEAYLARTRRWREQRPRFTDKMTGNWMYVGAILAMLPNARVVIVRRDPLETCFGCYRYYFNGHQYTHTFDDLATAWRGFDEAAKQWQLLYPQRVHELIYERLVDEPDAQIRALLAFCNLAFEENCLEFHSTKRRVTTPSAAQVRQPMRGDTARTNKYGALLDPLRMALGLPTFSG